jgi:hypothetical protein
MDEKEFLIRLLRLAADDDDLDPDELEFAVITGGTTNVVERGKIVKSREVQYWPFEKGEILILPKEGYREPYGEGRSTAKWSVSEERFGHDWAAAKRRSDEVKAAPDRDAFARPDAPEVPSGAANRTLSLVNTLRDQ